MTFRELAPSLYSIVLGFKDFLLWWRSELTRSIPSFVASRIQKRAVALTLVTVSRDGCKLVGYPDRFPLAELGGRLQALEADGAVGGDGIHVHLAPDRCLRRTVSPRRLPISALRKAAELDVETQTPFTRDNVQILVPGEGAASAYYLVRSNILSDLRGQLQTASLAVHAISTAGEDGSLVRLTLNGLQQVGWRPSLNKMILAGTVAATAAFLIVSWYQLHSKADAAVAHLDAQIARAEGEARQARRSYDAYVARISQVAELRLERLAGPRATVMWEELSRIVPDSSYLTNLTTKDGTVEISGFSKTPSELIPLIEGSVLFEAAQFASPVVKVPGFDGDRYAISFRLSGARQ